MATFSQSTLEKVIVIDFYCASCQKQGQWAEFYCKKCLKFYCVKCVIKHGKKFKRHVTYGTEDKKMWPVPEKELQDLHEDKHIEGFCYIRIILAEVSVQGDPDQVFSVEGKSEYDVSKPSDSKYGMDIRAICALSDDQILVADYQNKRLYLLDDQYQVMGHSDLSSIPWDICQITPNEVAVAVGMNETYWVQFFSVNGGQLVNGTKFTCQHDCLGIAYNLQHLYLTSGTALFKYSMSGDLSNKLYEDTSDSLGVYKCAVSPSGDKIFVINYSHHKVLTLATDGTVLHTFTDPDLQGPHGIYVTDLGQVLVCGGFSNTIIQLDGKGKKKLATLATKRDGLNYPESAVCYNRSTASIIVARIFSNKILVFKVK